jgi:hypothetical protein
VTISVAQEFTKHTIHSRSSNMRNMTLALVVMITLTGTGASFWGFTSYDQEVTEGSGTSPEEEQSGSGDLVDFPETDRVIQEDLVTENMVIEEEYVLGCEDSMFGCCPDSELPQHGPNGDGCCLSSEEGCCNDFLRAKVGSDDDCGCQSSQFGCCPDGITSMWDAEEGGCGCKHTTFGCCQVNSSRGVPNML